MTQRNLQVNLKTFQRKWRIDPAYIRRYLRKVWSTLPVTAKTGQGRGQGKHPSEVTVVLLNDSQIRRYNKEYRKKDYATDVLSFPVNELQDKSFYLGDILLSAERAAQQAVEKGHTIQTELRILLLHGILHLLGFDHEVDSGQMERLERRIRKIVL